MLRSIRFWSGRGGWFKLPINRWLNQPPRLRDAKVASRNLLDRAATPPCPRRGISLDSNFMCKAPGGRGRSTLRPSLFCVKYVIAVRHQFEEQTYELAAPAGDRKSVV